MDNRTRPNHELFEEYSSIIEYSRSPGYARDTRALLDKFFTFIGNYPPSTHLAVEFLKRYQHLSQNSRARYLSMLNGFFQWYSGETLPIKIKSEKKLPQYTPTEHIEKLKTIISGKRSHKKSITRDVLLIETYYTIGARRSELAKLLVKDLHLEEKPPFLIIRMGKGRKDRVIPIPDELRAKLENFIRDKKPNELVFKLKPKSISHKIRIWADKAGLPDIHTHSFRHYFGTTMFQRHANPRAVQEVMGHADLATTARYAAVTAQDLREITDLMGDHPRKSIDNSEESSIQPYVSKKPAKLDHGLADGNNSENEPGQ